MTDINTLLDTSNKLTVDLLWRLAGHVQPGYVLFVYTHPSFKLSLTPVEFPPTNRLRLVSADLPKGDWQWEMLPAFQRSSMPIPSNEHPPADRRDGPEML